MVKTKTGTFKSDSDRSVAKLLSWQEHHRCHFVSFVMYISGTKFGKHCFNISRDILDSVFYYFICTVYYVITFLISIIQNVNIFTVERKKIFQKGKRHSPVF